MPHFRDSTGRSDRRYLFTTLGASLFLLSFELMRPLNGDNEIYQSMARELIRYHSLPYIGSWDQNFPGIVYLHWLSIIFFGNSAIGFRSFDVCFHLIMSWLFFRLLRRWLTPQLSLVAVLFYNFHYISGGLGIAGERDAFAAGFLIASTVFWYVILDKQSSSRRLKLTYAFAAGISIAIVIALRPTYGLFLFVGLAFLFRIHDRWLLIVSFIAGCSLVFLAILIPYLLIPGGIEQLYFSTISYNFDIWAQLRLPLYWLFFRIRQQKLFFVLGLMGLAFTSIPLVQRYLPRIKIVLNHVSPPSKIDLFLIGSYGFIGIASVLMMGKYWPYHFEVVILALAPFGAIGLQSAVQSLPRRSYKVAGIILLSGYSLFRVFPLYLVIAFFSSIAQHQTSTLGDSYSCEPGFPASVDAYVARYLDRSIPPGGRFECASRMAGVRWRVHRQSASRFTTFYPLIMTDPHGHHPDFQKAWRREYIDSLLSARPYYLVCSTVPVDTSILDIPSPAVCIHTIPGFDSEILPHYQFDTVMGTYVIWKRRS